jgi:poly(A) polymerase
VKDFFFFVLLFAVAVYFLSNAVNHHEIDLFLIRLLTHTDIRLAEEKSVTPAYLFAGFLWYTMLEKMKMHQDKGLREFDAFELAVKTVVATQMVCITIPKYFVSTMKEIWRLQFRFSKRLGRRSFKLLYEPRFRAAYDFLLLRSEVDPKLVSLAKWWTEFSEGDEDVRQRLVGSLKKTANVR